LPSLREIASFGSYPFAGAALAIAAGKNIRFLALIDLLIRIVYIEIFKPLQISPLILQVEAA